MIYAFGQTEARFGRIDAPPLAVGLGNEAIGHLSK